MLLVRLVLATALAFQDPDLDRLIEQLGDGTPERRESAARKLAEVGPRATDALLRARNSPDSEVRTRVDALLLQYDRDRAQEKLERQERPRRLKLVTLEVQDAPLTEVIEIISKQLGMKFQASMEIDPNRRVTLHAKDQPLIQVLDQMGLGYSRPAFTEKLTEIKTPESSKYIPGARFTFERQPWIKEERRLGVVFTTEVASDSGQLFPLYPFDLEIEWNVASIRTTREVAFETCDLHSPRLVYVPDPDLGEAVVLLRGTRRWFCDTPISFSYPSGTEMWKAGPFEISLRWPSILIRSGHPIKKDLLEASLRLEDIKFTLKPGKGDGSLVGGGGSGSAGHYAGRFGGKNAVWCGCVDKPTKGTLKSPEMAREHLVPTLCDHPLEDVETLTLNFHKLIEEPIEVTSPPLK